MVVILIIFRDIGRIKIKYFEELGQFLAHKAAQYNAGYNCDENSDVLVLIVLLANFIYFFKVLKVVSTKWHFCVFISVTDFSVCSEMEYDIILIEISRLSPAKLGQARPRT